MGLICALHSWLLYRSNIHSWFIHCSVSLDMTILLAKIRPHLNNRVKHSFPIVNRHLFVPPKTEVSAGKKCNSRASEEECDESLFCDRTDNVCRKCLNCPKTVSYTSTKLWRGYIFTAVCLCVCVSICVFVRLSFEQSSSQTDELIWMRFSLNGCFPNWLKPDWNWWPWVKGQGHSYVIPIFSSKISVNFPTFYFSSLMSGKNKIWYVA